MKKEKRKKRNKECLAYIAHIDTHRIQMQKYVPYKCSNENITLVAALWMPMDQPNE